PGPVAGEAGVGGARIPAGPPQYAVRVVPAEEFLRLPEPSGEAVTLVATDFAEALRQVVPAASRDEARPILTGVLMAAEAGGLRLVGTGSHRLARRHRPGRSPPPRGSDLPV